MGRIMLISDYVSYNIIIWFLDLIHFRELGQKYKNIVVRFSVQMRSLEFAFEINWPLSEFKQYIFDKKANSCEVSIWQQINLISK